MDRYADQPEESFGDYPDTGLRSWSRILAFLLSVLPGFGHLYKGRRLQAFLWFCVVAFGYVVSLMLVLTIIMFPFLLVTVPVTLLMHFICAISAACGQNPSRPDSADD